MVRLQYLYCECDCDRKHNCFFNLTNPISLFLSFSLSNSIFLSHTHPRCGCIIKHKRYLHHEVREVASGLLFEPGTSIPSMGSSHGHPFYLSCPLPSLPPPLPSGPPKGTIPWDRGSKEECTYFCHSHYIR